MFDRWAAQEDDAAWAQDNGHGIADPDTLSRAQKLPPGPLRDAYFGPPQPVPADTDR
jgi:hypothetical protein